jgi:hypothetical protein
MSNGDEKIKIEILNQSILNSWQDVFPLKTNYQSNIKLNDNLRNVNIDEIKY